MNEQSPLPTEAQPEALGETATPQPPTAQPRPTSKTPMYSAMHAARYLRQNLIREIEESSERQLICFICGKGTEITRDDVVPFVDLLYNIDPKRPIDLMLHTPGGDVDAAEKLINLVRAAIGEEGSLRIVVPDYAKSAGTLMALGANSIVMGDSSELGPIDPQVWLKDGQGNEMPYSVLTFLEAFELQAKALRDSPEDPVNQLLLQKFQPTVVLKMKTLESRIRVLAEGLAKKRGLPFSKISSELMNTKKWISHSQMIGWQEAREIGLMVDYLPPDDPLWRLHWQLFCYQREAIGDRQKLFESNYVFLAPEG